MQDNYKYRRAALWLAEQEIKAIQEETERSYDPVLWAFENRLNNADIKFLQICGVRQG